MEIVSLEAQPQSYHKSENKGIVGWSAIANLKRKVRSIQNTQYL